MNLYEQYQQYMAKARELLTAAKAIAETAETAGRDLSETERADFSRLVKEADSFREKGTQAKANYDALAELDRIAGDPPSVKGSGWATEVMSRLSGLGLKSMLAGEISVPSPVEVAPLPDVPTRLLDLIAKVPHDSNDFSFLRQVAKDNRADVVADFGPKPVSVYTFREVADRCRVVAHVSEPIPVRYLSDYGEMMRIVDSQMRAGVLEALESQVIYGTGQGEDLEGLLTVSDTTSVPFETDLLTTARSARTTLEMKGEVPNAWCFAPEDLQDVDLLRELGDSGGAFLVDASVATTVFGNMPRVSCPALPPGTALLADWSQVEVLVREDAGCVAATQAAGIFSDGSGPEQLVSLFERNLCLLRAEGRFGLKVYRPQAIAIVSLYPGSSS